MTAENLDDFLSEQKSNVHKSAHKLVKLCRLAYPIGVPALIMKSSTDRLTTSSGYEFILGTPDDLLRRLASWLFTNVNDSQITLLKLIQKLWERHGREDVALASILLANLDHSSLSTNPWEILSNSIQKHEPIEGLLLCIEELFRANHPPPIDEQYIDWLSFDESKQHLTLLIVHAGMVRNFSLSDDILERLQTVKVPVGDSLLGRIKDRLFE